MWRDRWWGNDVVFERLLFVLVQKAWVQVGDKTPLGFLDEQAGIPVEESEYEGVCGRPQLSSLVTDVAEKGG